MPYSFTFYFACYDAFLSIEAFMCFPINYVAYKGAGRGAMAAEDISIGDVALEIPEALIICEELVFESDMVC